METKERSVMGFLLSLQTLPLENGTPGEASVLSSFSLTLCPSTTSQFVC